MYVDHLCLQPATYGGQPSTGGQYSGYDQTQSYSQSGTATNGYSQASYGQGNDFSTGKLRGKYREIGYIYILEQI